MSEDSGEKTEAPTAKRKKDAVEKGDILKSRDFATALSMLAGVAWLIYAGPTLITACKAIMRSSFQFTHADVEDFAPWRPLMEAGGKLAPSLITLFIVSIGRRTASMRVATIMPARCWLNLRSRAKIGSAIDSPAVRCGTSSPPAPCGT